MARETGMGRPWEHSVEKDCAHLSKSAPPPNLTLLSVPWYPSTPPGVTPLLLTGPRDTGSQRVLRSIDVTNSCCGLAQDRHRE